MGNTNLPQFGAADTSNSRDTRSGADQLTDAQKKERDDAQKEQGVGPAPGRPANAPDRIPGQQLDPDEDVEKFDGVNKKHSADSGLRSPGDAADIAGSAAITGHVDTGHSSSDAT
jgi:hypothetical protein